MCDIAMGRLGIGKGIPATVKRRSRFDMRKSRYGIPNLYMILAKVNDKLGIYLRKGIPMLERGYPT